MLFLYSMNAYELIKQLENIKDIVESFEIQKNHVTNKEITYGNGGRTTQTIYSYVGKNHLIFLDALQQLEQLGIKYNFQHKNMLSKETLYFTEDNTYHKILSDKTELLVELSNIIHCLETTMPEEKEHGIILKIPSDKSIEEVGKIYSKLNLVFKVLYDKNEEDIKIEGCIKGSQWIFITLSSAPALHIVFLLLKGVLKLQHQQLENKKLAEEIRALKIDNDFKEESYDMRLKMMKEIEAKKIYNELGRTEPTELEQIKTSLNTLLDLYEQGVSLSLNDKAKEEYRKQIDKQEQLLSHKKQELLPNNDQEEIEN